MQAQNTAYSNLINGKPLTSLKNKYAFHTRLVIKLCCWFVIKFFVIKLTGLIHLTTSRSRPQGGQMWTPGVDFRTPYITSSYIDFSITFLPKNSLEKPMRMTINDTLKSKKAICQHNTLLSKQAVTSATAENRLCLIFPPYFLSITPLLAD